MAWKYKNNLLHGYIYLDISKYYHSVKYNTTFNSFQTTQAQSPSLVLTSKNIFSGGTYILSPNYGVILQTICASPLAIITITIAWKIRGWRDVFYVKSE